MFKPTAAKSVAEYLSLINELRKSEILNLHKFIQKIVPKLKSYFASNMIGYGEFHYKSKSGREGDWPVIALASQKIIYRFMFVHLKMANMLPNLIKAIFQKPVSVSPVSDLKKPQILI